jgi:hypothetical protein
MKHVFFEEFLERPLDNVAKVSMISKRHSMTTVVQSLPDTPIKASIQFLINISTDHRYFLGSFSQVAREEFSRPAIVV